MRVESLDHLVLTVADVEATAAFYARVLGMSRVDFAEGRVAVAFGDLKKHAGPPQVFLAPPRGAGWAKPGPGGAQKINLHPAAAPLAPHPLHPTRGSADLCFVSSQRSEEWLAHLAALGVPAEAGPVPRTGARGAISSVYFRDPDGNLIEIAQYPAG